MYNPHITIYDYYQLIDEYYQTVTERSIESTDQ